mgnify:CR=1 FL=1
MTKFAWSYSSLGLFQQCPKKYYHLRVLKDTKEPESEPMLYGKAVHEAAEKYIGEDVPIPTLPLSKIELSVTVLAAENLGT